MKTRILMTVVLLLLVFGGVSSQNAGTPAVSDEPVKIFTTPETRDLVDSWISEYLKSNAGMKYEISSIGMAEINSEIVGERSVGFVMQRPGISMSDGSMWMMTLGREVIVAVCNEENPFTKELFEKGVSAEELATVLNRKHKNWGTLAGNENRESVDVYILDEPEVKFSVAKFLETDPSIIAGQKAVNKEEFLASVSKDKYAVGFCCLSTILNSETQTFAEKIKLLPIDRNGNGRLDYSENFYASAEQFERSVWIGKYPRALVHSIYAVAPAFLENSELSDFLSWLTTSGQTTVEESGFTDLVYGEKQSNLEKLIPPVLLAENQTGENTRSAVLLWAILTVLALGLLVAVVVFTSRRRKAKAPLLSKTRLVKLFSEQALTFPNGLYFDKSHTWVFMEKGGRVRLGVDDFISNVTGDYTRVIMKSPGEKVKRMEPVVTLIRKGKQITLNSPVSGTIKEINESLVADPFNINNEPYGEGWVYKIEPSNWLREIQFFKMGDSYRQWISGEFIRLKDFLACSLNIKNMEEGKLAFQEGGELMLHPLKDLEPKVWEDFQNYFINTADMY
ncbi:hypothetical protein [Maribellus sp. YY47]|uniref:glycine cleavage system protein H n=1 Tax=Maribellus sp. YY47 TaxID=2929486 RepID=UPI0020011B63|nr:hypothetical protein [Maribellus sp. YY47]MCK3682983.1 hypothetical protein [Maribellus sp. YY47]